MYKLLVVDDEKDTRNALCNYFPWDEMGFEVISQFENGKQALDFISSNHVDAVLCDIKMPVVSGIELAAEVHKQKLKIKVVFLSGYREFEYAQKALSYGVKDYIVKPAKYKRLVEVFSRVKDELDEVSGIQCMQTANTPQEKEAYSLNEKIIAAVKGYVQNHYKDATLEKAAELVHMNSNYLSEFFKQKTGQNFSDYLLAVKMEKAAELLCDINYKTYEVSELMGYSNSKNFARTFKNYFGKSPREFRNAGGTSTSESVGENDEEVFFY